jgi:hypothetical protein
VGGYERGFSGAATGAYEGILLGAAAQGDQRITTALLQADPDNSSNVRVGFAVSGNTPIVLVPGAAITVPVRRLNLLRVSIAADDILGYMAFVAA